MRNRLSIHLLSLLLVFLASEEFTHAGIYRCIDDAGHVTFQQQSCNGLAPDTSRATAAGKGRREIHKHFLWRATSPSGTVYLLGSIHFGRPEMYPLPAVITKAVEASDTLLVEANMLSADPRELAAKIAVTGMYSGGTSLRDGTSPAQWRKLEEAAARFALPVASLERQKPWLASMTLTALALQQIGYDAQLGVDMYLMKKVRKRMPIRELESFSQQIELLDGLSRGEQMAMLEQTLDEIHNGEEYFATLLDTWRRGATGELESLLKESFSASHEGGPLYRRLIEERNTKMARKLLDILRSEGGIKFVIVGAGHLTGRQGIVEQLRRHGYRIEQM